MPNVALIKNDFQPLILPATSITGIIPVTGEDLPDQPGALCIIYSNFRNGTTYFLGQPAAEVAASVAAAGNEALVGFEAALHPDEQAFIEPSTILHYEGFPNGGREDGPWVKVFVSRASRVREGAGEGVISLHSMPAIFEKLNAILFPTNTTDNVVKLPNKGKKEKTNG